MSQPLSLQALIFDVEGTLADTQDAHRAAYNRAFAELGLGWHWDEAQYAELRQAPGGTQRLRRYWQGVDPELTVLDAPAMEDTLARIHALKTAYYEAAIGSGAIGLRPGVLALIEQAQAAGLRLALVSTTSPVNAANLLRRAIGPDWRLHFALLCDASSASPQEDRFQAYRRIPRALGLPAQACLALEDCAHGVRAALRAGVPAIVAPTRHTRGQDFSGAARVLSDLAGTRLSDLRGWHRSGQSDARIPLPA